MIFVPVMIVAAVVLAIWFPALAAVPGGRVFRRSERAKRHRRIRSMG